VAPVAGGEVRWYKRY